MFFNEVFIYGAGYVGMSMASLIGQKHQVTIIENNSEKINLINSCLSPVKDDLVQEYLAKKKLNIKAVKKLPQSFSKNSLFILSLPTNYDESKNLFDTSIIESVLKEIHSNSAAPFIVIKSTIPVGFTEEMKKRFKNEKIIFSPEFLREGTAFKDNLYPSRIVIGGNCDLSKEFGNLLKSLAKNDPNLHYMDSKEAESVKLFSNSYLALRISFFNELDSFSLQKKLDSRKVIEAVCDDQRIGHGYNNPSFGYGGYCLPKDTKQLLSNYEGIPQNLIHGIVVSNSTRQHFIADHIINKSPENVGIYRLIMKEGSDNFRESSVIEIIKILKKNGINILIYEPLLKTENFMECRVIDNLDDLKKNCDVVLANRLHEDLNDIYFKVVSRDIFRNN